MLDVVVGIVRDARDHVLIQQRDDGPFAGLWEFPGGKRKSGESDFAALKRELEEELAISVRASRPLIRLQHRYPDRVVLLSTYEVLDYDGVPAAAEGQPLRWVQPRALLEEPMLPADRPISVAINLPSRYGIVSADGARPARCKDAVLTSIRALVADGVSLIGLRLSGVDEAVADQAARAAAACCREHGVGLVLHGDGKMSERVRACSAAGLNVAAKALPDLASRPVDGDVWFGVTAHSAGELEDAQRLGADFAVFDPVTDSKRSSESDEHSGVSSDALWSEFSELVANRALPVYRTLADADDRAVDAARTHGGQGVAFEWRLRGDQ